MDILRTAGALIILPVVIIYRLAIAPLHPQEQNKPTKRVIGDAVFRWLIYTLPIPQLARLLPTTHEVYVGWMKKKGFTPVVEDIGLGDDAKLLWIGSQDVGKFGKGKVVLFTHGGGFCIGMPYGCCGYWLYIQTKMKEKYGADISIAILRYGLVPRQHFPAPLLQAAQAANHLLASGIPASSIILSGDSAGANIALSLLLHTATPIPIPEVPKVTLPTGQKFGGICMLSPYLDILARNPTCKSYQENEKWDITFQANLRDLGERIMAAPSLAKYDTKAVLPYIDSQLAPVGFYASLPSVVSSMLITAGGAETMRDDIVQFSETVKGLNWEEGQVVVLVDEYGVHADPVLNFFAGVKETQFGELVEGIVAWFGERVKV